MLGMQSLFTRLLVLLDYDGTITAHECNELVFQRFSGNAWRGPEEELNNGLIGHAECFRRQVALVNASRERLLDASVEAAELAPGFGEFTEALVAGGARVAVVSAGFREVIEAVWRREGLPPVQLFASELVGEHPPLGVTFNRSLGDCPVCGTGTCKGGLARLLRRAGDVVAVFGDGHSDLCMAREADVVFARDALAGVCRAQAIEFYALDDYRTALAQLGDELASLQRREASA